MVVVKVKGAEIEGDVDFARGAVGDLGDNLAVKLIGDAGNEERGTGWAVDGVEAHVLRGGGAVGDGGEKVEETEVGKVRVGLVGGQTPSEGVAVAGEGEVVKQGRPRQ